MNPFKRLLASLYDSLLVLATLFIASAISLFFTERNITTNIVMTVYLLGVIYLFYGWFWTHGGQTLGMRAWKQKLVQFDGQAVSWQQAFIRFITALPAWCLFLFGLLLWMLPEKIVISGWLTLAPYWALIIIGLVWLYFDNRSNNWRDKLSGTHIITIDKNKPL